MAAHPDADIHGSDDSSRVQRILRRRQRERRRRSLQVQAGRMGLLIALLAVWEGAVRLGLINPFFWASPSRIWDRTERYLLTGQILGDIWATFAASIIGFVIGTVVGTVFGLALWWSRYWDRLFDPYMVSFNAMPKVALAPLVTVAFGIGMISKVVLAVTLVAVIAALSARDGARSVDPDLERLLYSLGATKRQVFVKVVFRWSLPWVFSAFRINIGLALIGVVVGEFIGGRRGLGIVAVRAAATYDVALTWVAVFTLMILAVVMYVAIERLEQVLSRTVAHRPSASGLEA